MRRATRSEPERAGKKVLLVDGLQHHDDRPLRHLVLEGWKAEGPKRSSSIALGDVYPSDRRCLVAAGLDALQEVPKVGLQVLRVLYRRDTVDTGSTILAGEPVGFPHPFQIENVVQRGQCPPAFRSCQFSYPLPFRGQVCETQGSLPCFPSAVLSSGASLPSIGSRSARFPNVISTMKGLRPPPPASPVAYLVRFRCPRDSSAVRARCCQRSRAGGGPA